jgi:hypothetical protein
MADDLDGGTMPDRLALLCEGEPSMSLTAERHGSAVPDRSRVALWVLGGANGGLFLAAGLLLWWRRGDAVFSEYVLSAFAWCF